LLPVLPVLRLRAGRRLLSVLAGLTGLLAVRVLLTVRIGLTRLRRVRHDW
jgi:hypothetical protein